MKNDGSYLRVEVKTERREVGSESEGDEVGVGLCGADEGEQADHAELVRHHRGRDVLHRAVGRRLDAFLHRLTDSASASFVYAWSSVHVDPGVLSDRPEVPLLSRVHAAAHRHQRILRKTDDLNQLNPTDGSLDHHMPILVSPTVKFR